MKVFSKFGNLKLPLHSKLQKNTLHDLQALPLGQNQALKKILDAHFLNPSLKLAGLLSCWHCRWTKPYYSPHVFTWVFFKNPYLQNDLLSYPYLSSHPAGFFLIVSTSYAFSIDHLSSFCSSPDLEALLFYWMSGT